MVSLDDYYYLGKIIKPQGLEGWFLVTIDTTNPEDYIELESVYVLINHNLVPFFIADMQWITGSKCRILFEDVTEISQIKELAAKELYLPLAQLPDLSEQEFYYHEVAGFNIIDTKYGPIGILQEIVDNPAHPIFQIQFKEKEILIPYIPQTFVSINKVKKEIIIEAPEGLIDFYLNLP